MAEMKLRTVGRVAWDIEFDLETENFDRPPQEIWNKDNILMNMVFQEWFLKWDGDITPKKFLVALALLIRIVEKKKLNDHSKKGWRFLTGPEKKSLVIAVILKAIDKLDTPENEIEEKEKQELLFLAEFALSAAINDEVAMMIGDAVQDIVTCQCFPCFAKVDDDEAVEKRFKVDEERLIKQINSTPVKPEKVPLLVNVNVNNNLGINSAVNKTSA
jgi:hypothetical protein